MTILGILSVVASMVQLQAEINCLNKEERQEILKEANLPVTIPANQKQILLYPGQN